MAVLRLQMLGANERRDPVSSSIGGQPHHAQQGPLPHLVPLISHSPVVFWLLPAFGVRGAGYFLGTTEMIFGSLILLGYWSPRLGILGALGSIVTFIGTTSIIPFLPNGWAHEAGGFPIMTLPLGFLMKDVLFLAASFYLLKQDLTRAALEITQS